MPVIDDDIEFNVALPDPLKVHECKVFGPFASGALESLDEEPRFNEVPAEVDNLVGRQVELFEVIHSVLNHRLVNIMGLPGIGKTALAKNAVNYMKDRRLFKLGIIFFSLKGYKSTNVFMKKVVTNLVREKFELEPQERKDIEENDFEKLLSMVTGYFKTIDERLLVVFDNAEELLYYDNLNFREFLTQLLHAGPNASFLMTSRVTIGVL